MKKYTASMSAALTVCLLFIVARANENIHKINLPMSKTITVPVPGFIARTNSHPATKGVRLKPLILEPGSWFAWAEFHPKTDVFHGGSNQP